MGARMKQQPGDVVIGAGVVAAVVTLTYLVSGPGAVVGLLWTVLTAKFVLHLLSRDDEGARLLGTLLLLAVLLRHLMPRRYKRMFEQWQRDGAPPKLDPAD